jgi:hypothetical protein
VAWAGRAQRLVASRKRLSWPESWDGWASADSAWKGPPPRRRPQHPSALMQPPAAMLPTADLSAETAAWRWGGDWRRWGGDWRVRCCRSSSSQAAGQTPAQIGHAGRHGEGGGPGVWGPEGLSIPQSQHYSIPQSLPCAHSTPKPLSLTHTHSYTHTCTRFPSPRFRSGHLLAFRSAPVLQRESAASCSLPHAQPRRAQTQGGCPARTWCGTPTPVCESVNQSHAHTARPLAGPRRPSLCAWLPRCRSEKESAAERQRCADVLEHLVDVFY